VHALEILRCIMAQSRSSVCRAALPCVVSSPDRNSILASAGAPSNTFQEEETAPPSSTPSTQIVSVVRYGACTSQKQAPKAESQVKHGNSFTDGSRMRNNRMRAASEALSNHQSSASKHSSLMHPGMQARASNMFAMEITSVSMTSYMLRERC